MPTISVVKTPFLKAIGWDDATDKNIHSLCFEFGIELDDIVDPKEERSAAALMGGGKERANTLYVLFCVLSSFFCVFFRPIDATFMGLVESPRKRPSKRTMFWF